MQKKRKVSEILGIAATGFLSFVMPAVGTALWLFYRKSNTVRSRAHLALSVVGLIANYLAITYLEQYTGITIGR